jgi:prepilin-type N-terminal cleavage/methylation domain-containing protein
LKNNRGFTLIELMIVIAIIAIIAAIAIPNLIEARKGSNEAAAIGALRTMTTAQALFREGDKDKDTVLNYATAVGPQGTANTLSNTGLVDGVLGSGTKQGYLFKIVTADPFTWSAQASPASPGKSGDRYFFVDESGVIRFATNQPATSTNSAIGG